jgi:hypothetical protein
MVMPIYNVKYSRTDYFEKDYEADSYEEAQDMFDMDRDKWDDGFPHHSDEEFIDIQEV